MIFQKVREPAMAKLPPQRKQINSKNIKLTIQE